MEPERPYQRHHYRVPLPTEYPVMFSDATIIGEGKVTNLTVLGCAIECAGPVPAQTKLLIRLILPDQSQSLPIEEAEVRWVEGKRLGIQFKKLDPAAELRLHGFVWDRMLERLRTVVQDTLPTSCS
jgi:c-di-GMP-binding flagellar brake protein YcgR